MKKLTLEQSCIWHPLSIREPESAPMNLCLYCDSYDLECPNYRPQKVSQIPIRQGCLQYLLNLVGLQ